MMPAFSSPAPTMIFGDLVGKVLSDGRLVHEIQNPWIQLGASWMTRQANRTSVSRSYDKLPTHFARNTLLSLTAGYLRNLQAACVASALRRAACGVARAGPLFAFPVHRISSGSACKAPSFEPAPSYSRESASVPG